MSTVRESIECAVPVSVAYERLCHFENYPQFMSGVKEVTQLSDTMAHWVMDLGGRQQEFDAQITDQRTDELLAWTAVDGPRLTEKVTFQQLADDKCRIIAELDIDAQLLMPSDMYAQDSLNRRLKADLDGLKQYVEQGAATLSSITTSPKTASAKPASSKIAPGSATASPKTASGKTPTAKAPSPKTPSPKTASGKTPTGKTPTLSSPSAALPTSTKSKTPTGKQARGANQALPGGDDI